MSKEIAFARLLRPFPIRRLEDGLYRVGAEAHSISQQVNELYRRHPGSPEEWREALDRLDMSLESLRARCGDARPLLAQMFESSDGDWRRGTEAALVMLKGLQLEAELDEVAGATPLAA